MYLKNLIWKMVVHKGIDPHLYSLISASKFFCLNRVQYKNTISLRAKRINGPKYNTSNRKEPSPQTP
jgi:hypothetical protein